MVSLNEYSLNTIFVDFVVKLIYSRKTCLYSISQELTYNVSLKVLYFH